MSTTYLTHRGLQEARPNRLPSTTKCTRQNDGPSNTAECWPCKDASPRLRGHGSRDYNKSCLRLLLSPAGCQLVVLSLPTAQPIVMVDPLPLSLIVAVRGMLPRKSHSCWIFVALGLWSRNMFIPYPEHLLCWTWMGYYTTTKTNFA